MADAATQGPSAVIKQLKELWAQQSRSRRLLALAVVGTVIAIVVVSRLWGGESSWAVVADGASPDDTQELLAALEQRGLPVRLANGRVQVPSDKVDQARAIAAAAGLPRVGKGFELFDGAHLGQSSFTEQVNFRRALQGELARSITALAQVQGARVHLALARRSVFKDQEQGASASVALHLHAGQTLTGEQVRGIRQLVAASVEGLRPDAVVIVDQHGNLLDGAEPNAATRSAAIEQTISSRVRALLERVVGPGKVWVVTNAAVDSREVSETQEVFDHQNPVVRSESRVLEGTDPTVLAGVGGVAGTRGNLPGATPAAGTGSAATPASGSGRMQETKNYEISRTVRQVKKPEPELAKLYVAVVVDHKKTPDGKTVPRSEQELAELTALARQAAGIDEARGDKLDVRSIAFASDGESAADTAGAPPAPSLLPVPLPIAIGAGACALVLIALIALVVRRKRSRQRQARGATIALPAPVAELERALDARAREDVAPAGLPAATEPAALPPGPSTRERVLAAVRADVDRAAEVLTAWLSEPPPKPTPNKVAKS
jgi:flagellar M-ring protein FliF